MKKLEIKNWVDESRDGVGGICLQRNDEKQLEVDFAGNLDLYFTLRNFGQNPSFVIAKDNFHVYEVFDKLYVEVLNGSVFEPMSEAEVESLVEFCDWRAEDYHEALKNKLEEQEKIKSWFKNEALLNGLVQNGKIVWHSDDYPYDEAPYMIIEKLEDSYKLSFYNNINDSKFISIRFRNSGSRYGYFSGCFMRAYRELQQISNNVHQIHIEEYLIDKNLENSMKLERMLK